MKNGHDQPFRGAGETVCVGSQSGRFVNRLDEQDREIAALKDRCDLLTVRNVAANLLMFDVQKFDVCLFYVNQGALYRPREMEMLGGKMDQGRIWWVLNIG